MESDNTGRVNVEWVEKFFASGQRAAAIVCQQGSNVTGILQPIEELCALGDWNNAAVIVDGSQAGGHLPLNLDNLKPSAWVCSGHKGLRGIKGVGIVYLREDFAPAPLVTGGTGYGDEKIPELMRPEAYEAGTNPLPAIVALGAAIEHAEKTIDTIRAEELKRVSMFLDGIKEMGNVDALGIAEYDQHLPIVSVVSRVMNPDELAFTLLKKYGIETRSGVHCAPRLHKHFGTFKHGGAVRFSFSYATPEEDIHFALQALREISQK